MWRPRLFGTALATNVAAAANRTAAPGPDRNCVRHKPRALLSNRNAGKLSATQTSPKTSSTVTVSMRPRPTLGACSDFEALVKSPAPIKTTTAENASQVICVAGTALPEFFPQSQKDRLAEILNPRSLMMDDADQSVQIGRAHV